MSVFCNHSIHSIRNQRNRPYAQQIAEEAKAKAGLVDEEFPKNRAPSNMAVGSNQPRVVGHIITTETQLVEIDRVRRYCAGHYREGALESSDPQCTKSTVTVINDDGVVESRWGGHQAMLCRQPGSSLS